jgi:CubicO group peptidase (beta-lactamase class C family)
MMKILKIPHYSRFKTRMNTWLLAVILGQLTVPACESGHSTEDFFSGSAYSLLKFKKSRKVPGLAYALFDRYDTLFTSCMGTSSLGSDIDRNTLFSLQSISKNMTALAVMKAVQEGLLDLDVPISIYLPSFSVQSCFDSVPEDLITLRMLLSHTAGFTHEAPVGNNYDFTPCRPEEHLLSIRETWLKFPPGTAYAYSNLGFDLASAIVEEAAGIGFSQYLKTELFQPLGMTLTTNNDQEVLQTRNRTDGKIPDINTRHYSIPLPGSGATYSNLSDMIRYTQMLMNYGEGAQGALLDKGGILDMCTIRKQNYGLGTYINTQDHIWYVNHNGGGFGFSATLLWLPEYGLGSVLLCNKAENTFDICMSLMQDYIAAENLEKDPDVTAEFEALNPAVQGAVTEPEDPSETGDPMDIRTDRNCDCETWYRPEWEKYLGEYSVLLRGMDLKWYARLAQKLGLGYQQFWIDQEDQVMTTSGFTGESVLREYRPGLFFTDDYEVLDLRGEQKTFRNIRVISKKERTHWDVFESKLDSLVKK